MMYPNSVWPDDVIKSLSFLPKASGVFTEIVAFIKLAQKDFICLGSFWKNICHDELFK